MGRTQGCCSISRKAVCVVGFSNNIQGEYINLTLIFNCLDISLCFVDTCFIQLLNRPNLRHITQKFSICEHGNEFAKSEVENAINTMKKIKPGGVTPLTQHIWEIQEQVTSMAHDLRESGKQVAIILATDGLPTDDRGYGGKNVMDEFVSALRSLEGLPIWVVIRLCTDEDKVCNFYNSLDAQLELSLEVLDDYVGEAKEVYAKNPWLCYGLPMHRCRELVSCFVPHWFIYKQVMFLTIV